MGSLAAAEPTAVVAAILTGKTVLTGVFVGATVRRARYVHFAL
jgi:hypothetical protein